MNEPTSTIKNVKLLNEPINSGHVPVMNSIVETIQIIRNERPHSYEYGKAGARVKIYFETIEELREKIIEIKRLEQELRVIEDGN